MSQNVGKNETICCAGVQTIIVLSQTGNQITINSAQLSRAQFTITASFYYVFDQAHKLRPLRESKLKS